MDYLDAIRRDSTASDMLLVTYTRLPIGDLEVFGDQSLAQELVDRLNTT